MRTLSIQPEQACDGGLPPEEVCLHEPKVRARASVLTLGRGGGGEKRGGAHVGMRGRVRGRRDRQGGKSRAVARSART